MTSGSHSLTLGRLYAWEKKLFEEVKDGDSIRRIYKRRCNQLRNQDARGDDGLTVNKSRAAVKDLYSRILVAIRSAQKLCHVFSPLTVSVQCRMATIWRLMLEAHEIQNKIIFEVTTFSCPSYGKFCHESHRLATLQLETELWNWRACFTEYVEAQKGYVEALFGWLSKFVIPEVELHSKARASALLCRQKGHPLLLVCHDWLESMNNLPENAVSSAIKSCVKDVRALWLQQGEEQQQKRKVDSLSKELDRKTLGFQKAENRISEFSLTDKTAELEEWQAGSFVVEGKDMPDNLQKRVDMEKEKHRKQLAERITLNGFQTGFCRVFESTMEFPGLHLRCIVS